MSKPNTTQQKLIIDHREGPLAVVANPGSGKTHTCCARGAAMMNDGIAGRDHLMLTFSKKATNEMRQRMKTMVRDPASVTGQMIDTYHAFGYRLIRTMPAKCDRADGVTIIDDADRKRLIRHCAEANGFNLKDTPTREQVNGAFSVYSLAKNEGALVTMSSGEPRVYDLLSKSDKVIGNYERLVLMLRQYEQTLKGRNVCDFDDLILLPVLGMRKDPTIGQKLSRRFPFITVDEAQDTNSVQYEMIKQIGMHHRNVMMIGDDDQVLYSWRGARAENLANFIRDFNAKEAPLAQNFRSSPQIVAAATKLIAFNQNRLAKTPFSENQVGDAPALQAYANGYDMADGIADQIRAAIESGVAPDDIAVLYRTNRMSRLMEGSLRNLGIPYRVVGGKSIYSSPEVKACLAAVKLMSNPKDETALAAISEWIPGMGDKMVSAISAVLNAEDHSILDEELPAKLSPKAAEKVKDLQRRLDVLVDMGAARLGEWASCAEGLNIRGQYNDKLESDKPKDVDALQQEMSRRLSNLALLDRATSQGIINAGLIRGAPDYFEQQWYVVLESLLNDATPEAGTAADKGKVTLSTIHGSKGLEWLHVHIAGFSNCIMPLTSGMGDADEFGGGLEEERRLAYVALTRARVYCRLHHSDMLQLPGDDGARYMEPSPFAVEMELENAATVNEPDFEEDPLSGFGDPQQPQRTALRHHAGRDH